MPAALVTILATAAEFCPELAQWCRCEGYGEEHCEACALGGPDRCESEVIKALARRLADVQKL